MQSFFASFISQFPEAKMGKMGHYTVDQIEGENLSRHVTKAYSLREGIWNLRKKEVLQATIADILEHAGNWEFGTAAREFFESRQVGEFAKNFNDSVANTVSTTVRAIGDFVSAVGEIDPP